MTYTAPTTNISSSVDFFSWINTSVGSFFFAGIVLAAFFIILIKIIINNEGTGKAFAAASFICMIVSVLFRVADFVSTGFMLIFIIFSAIGVVWVHMENSGRFT